MAERAVYVESAGRSSSRTNRHTQHTGHDRRSEVIASTLDRKRRTRTTIRENVCSVCFIHGVMKAEHQLHVRVYIYMYVIAPVIRHHPVHRYHLYTARRRHNATVSETVGMMVHGAYSFARRDETTAAAIDKRCGRARRGARRHLRTRAAAEIQQLTTNRASTDAQCRDNHRLTNLMWSSVCQQDDTDDTVDGRYIASE